MMLLLRHAKTCCCFARCALMALRVTNCGCVVVFGADAYGVGVEIAGSVGHCATDVALSLGDRLRCMEVHERALVCVPKQPEAASSGASAASVPATQHEPTLLHRYK
jgi:hypothetical protein